MRSNAALCIGREIRQLPGMGSVVTHHIFHQGGQLLHGGVLAGCGAAAAVVVAMAVGMLVVMLMLMLMLMGMLVGAVGMGVLVGMGMGVGMHFPLVMIVVKMHG